MPGISRAVQAITGHKLHYAWIVVGLTFLVMLTAAGIRATPSVLIVPLEQSLHWSRASISLAIAINIALYGLMGPFAAALMQRIGVRLTIIIALGLLCLGTAISTTMTRPWHMILLWGLMVGAGTGIVGMTLGATIATRWFDRRRGLVMGVLSASSATGQLVFLPALAWIAETWGWRPVSWTMATVALLAIPLVALLLPERPAQLGLAPLGGTRQPELPSNQQNPVVVAVRMLGRAGRSRDFWLLFASFFVCGASTNGLIGTHLIPACLDEGIPETGGAALLAMMGIFDLVGTTASGWLSDRYDNRVLLFWYYGLRGLSLLFLPFAFGLSYPGLALFAVFFGLDWIATVPPTLRLTTDVFGSRDAPVVFGWILAGHQLGAAAAALEAGMMRAALGRYLEAFMISGVLCVGAAIIVLRIGRDRIPGPVEALS
ncbi:MAG: MFS transporter [Azospirillaceae bacterium]|nr:MFS transporter [Azospirillaceae bacterium]